jgi:phytoene/squalene synthetase
MKNATATLAHAITRESSKQSYYTARLLVDRELVDDCLRAYAYFRWADDIIDLSSRSREQRVSFIKRQRVLVDSLYRGVHPRDLTSEEEMVADLISHDREENSGLRSFICKFLDILEFDAHRKGRTISQKELTWYSDCLGRSVTDAIQYFVGNDHPYHDGDGRYLAATAAHITHMLRDMADDLADGFINIPRELLQGHGMRPEDIGGDAFRAWVRERVQQARLYFREGKRYLDQLDVLRCKLAAHWYCVRFECVLDVIERDDYLLRAEYNERRKLSTHLRIGWLGISITLRHFFRRGRRSSWDAATHSGFETTVTEHLETTIIAR